MVTLEEAAQFKEENLFRALEFAVFAKPAEEGDEEVTFAYDESGIFVPEGYDPVGFTTKDDGATWSRNTENSDDTSHGRSQPTRRDITSDVSGLSFTAQESKRLTMELFWSQEIAEQVTEHGIYWDKATRPSPRRVRLLGVATDLAESGLVVCARWLPNAQLDEGSDQTWSDSAATTYPLSFTAFHSSTFGTAFREMWGGPGFDSTARGF